MRSKGRLEEPTGAGKTSNRGTRSNEPQQQSARERLEAVWDVLQRHLTDDLCEEALDALQAIAEKAVRESQRREALRLFDAAALEHSQPWGLSLPDSGAEPAAAANNVQAEQLKNKRGRPKKVVRVEGDSAQGSGVKSGRPRKRLVVVVDDGGPISEKRKRGRPRKANPVAVVDELEKEDEKAEKKKRGRPKWNIRGRPRKAPTPSGSEDKSQPGDDDEQDNSVFSDESKSSKSKPKSSKDDDEAETRKPGGPRKMPLRLEPVESSSYE